MKLLWEAVIASGVAPYLLVFLAWMAANIVVGITRSRTRRGAARSVALRVLREVSCLTHDDEAGTFTIPKVARRILFAVIGARREPRSARDGVEARARNPPTDATADHQRADD